MQSSENSGLKVAEENLMRHIRAGKNIILKNRENILNRDIESKDKYDILFESLYNITLEDSKKAIAVNFKKFIEELTVVISDELYSDNDYLRDIIVKIELNIKNLKYIVADYKELTKYENILRQIKYQLTLRLFTNIHKEHQRKI